MTIKTIKTRIYLNNAQKQQVMSNFGACRFVWNQLLNLQKQRYDNGGSYINKYGMNYLITAIKREYPFLKTADSTSLLEVSNNLNQAYQRFFRQKKGFPKFKSRKYPRQSYQSNIVGQNIRQLDEFNKRQYYMNGGKSTLKHMLGTGASAHVMATMVHSKYPDIIKWLGELPTAIETPNVLGVHAGVTSAAHYEDTPDFDAIWVRDEYIYGNLGIGKVVVSGHTPTKLLCGRDDCPVVLDGDNAHYFIDAGEHALNRHLNVLVLDTTGALRNNYIVGSDTNGKAEKGSIVSLQRD